MPYNNQNTTAALFVVARLNVCPSLNFTQKTIVLVLHILACPLDSKLTVFSVPNRSQRRGTSPRSSQCDHWSLFKPPRGEGGVGFHAFETGTLAIHVRGVFFLPFLPNTIYTPFSAEPWWWETKQKCDFNHNISTQQWFPLAFGVYPIHTHIPTCTRYIFSGEQRIQSKVCMDQHSPVPFHLDDFTRYMERFAGWVRGLRRGMGP